jgi:hypothetical protein
MFSSGKQLALSKIMLLSNSLCRGEMDCCLGEPVKKMLVTYDVSKSQQLSLISNRAYMHVSAWQTTGRS